MQPNPSPTVDSAEWTENRDRLLNKASYACSSEASGEYTV